MQWVEKNNKMAAGLLILFISLLLLTLWLLGVFKSENILSSDYDIEIQIITKNFIDGTLNETGKKHAFALLKLKYIYITDNIINKFLSTDQDIYDACIGKYIIKPHLVDDRKNNTFLSIYNSINTDFVDLSGTFTHPDISRIECLFYIDLLYTQANATNISLYDYISCVSDKSLYQIYVDLYTSVFAINSRLIEIRIIYTDMEVSKTNTDMFISCLSIKNLCQYSIMRQAQDAHYTKIPDISELPIWILGLIATYSHLFENLLKINIFKDPDYNELLIAFRAGNPTNIQKDKAVKLLSINDITNDIKVSVSTITIVDGKPVTTYKQVYTDWSAKTNAEILQELSITGFLNIQ